MPKPTDSFFTPPSSYSPQKTLARLDLGLDSPSDDVLDADIFNMTGTGSPQPFIKEEVEDMSFNANRFVGHNGFDMNQQYGNPQFGSNHDNVNPSELNMSQSMMGGQFGSTSYIQGAAGIADDELADSLGGGYDQQQNYNAFGHGNANHQDYYQSHSNHPTINQIYSNTPDDLPIQSPFVHPGAFDFNQYHTPSRVGFPGSMSNAMRPARASMSRHASDSRTPMSPKTPGMASLNIGTPDSSNFTTQPIMTNTRGHKATVSMSNPGSIPWEGTPGSPHSWIDSPASPHAATMHHQQIADVLHSGKHSSLPAKVDIGQTQDAKKRRRRESHNLVERRRRDNINERIHDLSRLVPQHRLEDEKIRKHINNNGPMSPTMGTSGMSPPQATSLLAGGSGRRAAGNITQGLPMEEKDKGPNKGDILNGAVSWTRDLMWMLHKKIQECEELATRLQQATGEEWPVDQTEEEKRMKTEIMEALEKNGTGTFRYSRGPGSGLRVPHHTNLAGEPVNGISPQSLSPGMQSTGSGSGSNTQQYWSNQSLKEEDEYGMEMG